MKTLDNESLCLNYIETEIGVKVTQTGPTVCCDLQSKIAGRAGITPVEKFKKFPCA